MVAIASRMLRREQAKSAMTVAGIAIVLMLILFLHGIYEGVKTGVTGYVGNSPAEIWMCRKNSTNLLRSSSFMESGTSDRLAGIEGIGRVEGIARILTTCDIRGRKVTLFMIGLPEHAVLSRPTVIEGASHVRDGEIILDRAFAAKHALRVGDTVTVQESGFRVVGLSTETNATVATFCFVTAGDADRLIGFEGIVSFFLIASADGNAVALLRALRKACPDFSFYSKAEFMENHVEEIRTGFLPILWTIALLGFIVGSVLVTLMLYSTILERREDYALLKAVGMPARGIAALVLRQSAILAVSGCCSGVLLYLLLSPVLTFFVPEISLRLQPAMLPLLLAAALAFGGAGSIVSIRKVNAIYPAEVFRA
jgi:putative ABC transport system permease protein